MTIFCSTSSFSNDAEISFQFHRCNRLTWHLHLLEPFGQSSLIRSFHNAYDLSLRQVKKTSIWLHVGSFWAAFAIWLICSRVRAPAGTVWLLMNLGIIFFIL